MPCGRMSSYTSYALVRLKIGDDSHCEQGKDGLAVEVMRGTATLGNGEDLVFAVASLDSKGYLRV